MLDFKINKIYSRGISVVINSKQYNDSNGFENGCPVQQQAQQQQQQRPVQAQAQQGVKGDAESDAAAEGADDAAATAKVMCAAAAAKKPSWSKRLKVVKRWASRDYIRSLFLARP